MDFRYRKKKKLINVAEKARILTFLITLTSGFLNRVGHDSGRKKTRQ